MPQIPSELVCSILSKLETKDLCRFRCVSKEWRSLTDNPYFTRMHVNNSTRLLSNPKLILSNNVVSMVSSFNRDIKIDYFLDLPEISGVLCTCDGLLILGDCLQKEGFTLCNPITKECKILPDYHSLSCEVVCVGLGFDNINKGYKIVKIDVLRIHPHIYLPTYEVNVFSFKSNSWKQVENPPPNIEFVQRDGVLVSSALHWIASDSNVNNFARSRIIIAFDFGEEKFSFVGQPEYRNKLWGLSLGALNGNLCLCTCDEYFFNTWMMKNNDSEKCWTELFGVPRDTIISNVHLVRPLAYWKSKSEFLFSDEGKLYLYDVNRKTKKEIHDHLSPKTLCVGVFTESLVRLDG